MPDYKTLIVDDDDNICQLMKLYLVKEGFSTVVCNNGFDAIKKLGEETFDVVLLDVMMPVMDGLETLSAIRKFSNVPVIFVSAKGETMDKIGGLDVGADDYVTKPFEPQELISRIRAILRRSQSLPSGDKKEISIGNLYVDIQNYIVKVDNAKVEMPPKEIELLYYLATHPMRVFTRDQLLSSVWGAEFRGDARTIDVHVKRIREKLGVGTEWNLATVWRVGYKFEIVK